MGRVVISGDAQRFRVTTAAAGHPTFLLACQPVPGATLVDRGVGLAMFHDSLTSFSLLLLREANDRVCLSFVDIVQLEDILPGLPLQFLLVLSRSRHRPGRAVV